MFQVQPSMKTEILPSFARGCWAGKLFDTSRQEWYPGVNQTTICRKRCLYGPVVLATYYGELGAAFWHGPPFRFAFPPMPMVGRGGDEWGLTDVWL